MMQPFQRSGSSTSGQMRMPCCGRGASLRHLTTDRWLAWIPPKSLVCLLMVGQSSLIQVRGWPLQSMLLARTDASSIMRLLSPPDLGKRDPGSSLERAPPLFLVKPMRQEGGSMDAGSFSKQSLANIKSTCLIVLAGRQSTKEAVAQQPRICGIASRRMNGADSKCCMCRKSY